MPSQKKQLNNTELNSLEKAAKGEIHIKSYVQEVPLSQEEQDCIRKKMAEEGVKKVRPPEVIASLKWSIIVTGALVIFNVYAPQGGDQSLFRFWIRTVIQANTTLIVQHMKSTLAKQRETKK